MVPAARPLVLHVLHAFDTGGLENGVANLINHMPEERYRHAVLALTEVSDFRHRVERADVEFIALHKPPGQTAWQFHRLYQTFRRLRPAIVHSRNLAALEAQLPAWAAGVPVRIHGEHGLGLRSSGSSGLPYERVRRFYRPWVQHYLALSGELKHYLQEQVQVPAERISQVCNGVDTERFRPHPHGPQRIAGCPFDPAQHWLVGTVGRMQDIKDPLLLVRAFVLALASAPALRRRLRLVMVGEGPLRTQALAGLATAGLSQLAWLPGERFDVPEVLRGLHAFVLPSQSEGISNAILEAMASALPVLATQVGGNPELVLHGQTGYLVASGAPQPMAERLVQLASQPQHACQLGLAGRQRALAGFSLQAMVAAYQAIYDRQLQRTPAAQASA
jgi:sugar transferase (PEP-CTERM/EpsH1 system associated)